MRRTLAIAALLAATILPAQAYDRCTSVHTRYDLSDDRLDSARESFASESAKMELVDEKDTFSLHMAASGLNSAMIEIVSAATGQLAILEISPQCFKAEAIKVRKPALEKFIRDMTAAQKKLTAAEAPKP